MGYRIILTDPFSKSYERGADQFLGFAYNLALWDISWGKWPCHIFWVRAHPYGRWTTPWVWAYSVIATHSAWFATLPIFSPFWFVHEWWKMSKFESVTPNGVEVLLITRCGQNQLCLQKCLWTDPKLKISY